MHSSKLCAGGPGADSVNAIAALEGAQAPFVSAPRIGAGQAQAAATVGRGLAYFAVRILRPPLQRPQFNIHGVARRELMRRVPELSASQLSRQLRRLRVLGVLKRAANTYRYYLTRTGRLVIAAFERLTTFAIIPALARA